MGNQQKTKAQLITEIGKLSDELSAAGTRERHSPEEDDRRLLRKVQALLLEIGAQNAELLRSAADLDTAIRRYTDLYDLAPIGYMTLDRTGTIRRLNSVGSNLLGADVSLLIGTRAETAVSPESQSAFRSFLECVFANAAGCVCDVMLLRDAAPGPQVRMEASCSVESDEFDIALVDISDRKAIEDVQMFLLECGRSGSTEDVYRAVTRYLAELLGMDVVRVGRLSEDGLTAEALAIYSDGEFARRTTCALPGTPCAELAGRTVLSFAEGVRGSFPQDRFLEKMKAEGYVGATLWSSQGRAIGLLAAISRKPLANPALVESVMKLAAIRISGELERELAEEQLRVSEAKFRKLHESIRDALVTADMDGFITDCNEAYSEMLGYTLEELKTLTYNDLTPAKWHSLEARILDEQILQRGHSDVYEKEYRRKDGSILPVELRTVLLDDGNGAPLAMWAMVRDISERKQMEEALQLSERQYREVVLNTHEGHWVTDENDKTTAVNSQMAEMLGYTSEEMLGRALSGFVRQSDLPGYKRYLARGSRDDRHQGVFRFVRKDTTDLYADVLAAPVTDGEGVYRGARAFLADVTSQRETEKQLRQLQKLEALGTLAGGVAHDFRNLLMGISGSAELLQMRLGTEHPDAHLLNELLGCVDRASRLTGQLLTFGKRQMADHGLCDVNAVVTDTQKLLEPLIGASISVELDLAPDTGLVRTEPSSVEQIVLNLMVNARDAMPTGGQLRVSTRRRTAGGSGTARDGALPRGEYAELTVSDTGLGIAPGEIERVFEPFFTTKEHAEHSGLGLSVVHGIVDQNGGHIEIQSRLGEGASFRVLLPSATQEATLPPDAGMAEYSATQATVLLAEDEESIRTSAKTALEESGFTVIAAANGEEAVAAFMDSPEPIDLVILDLVMPRMGGFDAASEMMKTAPDLKVLFMSGHLSLAACDESKPGSSRVLKKPFRLAELVRRSRELLAE